MVWSVIANWTLVRMRTLLFLLFPAYSVATVTDSPSMFSPLAKNYQVKVVNRYPHNEDSFTQGLLYHSGFLYESVGLRGKSAVYKLELKTGKILQRFDLKKDYFGEGLALLPASVGASASEGKNGQKDRLVQVTYTAQKGFVYDRRTLLPVQTFEIPGAGWGLVGVGDELVMTDGSADLIFLDTDTFKVKRRLPVTDNGKLLPWLNELEYVDGFLLANIWQSDEIAVIDITNGKVLSFIDLSPLNERITVRKKKKHRGLSYDAPGVLNGIAFDAKSRRLFVTGKHWPWLFEVELVAR